MYNESIVRRIICNSEKRVYILLQENQCGKLFGTVSKEWLTWGDVYALNINTDIIIEDNGKGKATFYTRNDM